MTLKSDLMAAIDQIITPELVALADAAVAYAASRGTVTPPAPPPALGYYTVHGIQCHLFGPERVTVPAGEQLWFNFKVNNTLAEPVGYGVLAPRTEEGQCAQSWTEETLQPGQVLEWRDHITFTVPGAYHLYMGVAFDGHDIAATWFRLSDSVSIIVV